MAGKTNLTDPVKNESLTTSAFLSGKLAHVDVAKIEKELKGLWKSAAESNEDGGSVTRACAMNLVLYSQDEDAEISAGNILDEITTRHPCRAILAINRPEAAPKLEAWVSARCHITDSKSRKQICCEQITVLAEGTGTRELASVVSPLVISDLPVHLWWRSNQVRYEDLRPFLHFTDELIVDSADNGANGSVLLDLSSLMSEMKGDREIAISDLNWRRMFVWREALALAFDRKDGPITVAQLKNIASVKVFYKGGEANALLNQSLLFLGWLASRLEWKMKAAGGANKGDATEGRHKFEFDANGKEIKVELLPADAGHMGGDKPGSLTSVEVSFVDDSIPKIRIDYPEGAPGVRVHLGDSKRVEQKGSESKNDEGKNKEERENSFMLSAASESRVIDDELENAQLDPLFEPALNVAVQIARRVAE